MKPKREHHVRFRKISRGCITNITHTRVEFMSDAIYTGELEKGLERGEQQDQSGT